MLAAPHRKGIRQAADRVICTQREQPLDLVAGISPLVLGLEAEAEPVADAAQGRQHSFPGRGRAGDDRDRRLHRQFDVIVGRESIDQHTEFESRLDKGLHPHARRALARVAEPYADRVALAQEAAHNPDHQGFVPRPYIELRIVEHVEHRAVRRLDRGVIRCLRVVPLRPAHVAGKTMHDLY